MGRVERHQHLPRGSETWRERKSSPGSGPRRSPTRRYSTSGATSARCVARYSGGAAPASHRFPWLPLANRLSRRLSPPECAGKRKDHRAADDERKRDHVTRIDPPDFYLGGEVDERDGIRWNIVREKTPKASLLDRNWRLLLELCPGDAPLLRLDQHFEYLRVANDGNAERKSIRRERVAESELLDPGSNRCVNARLSVDKSCCDGGNVALRNLKRRGARRKRRRPYRLGAVAGNHSCHGAVVGELENLRDPPRARRIHGRDDHVMSANADWHRRGRSVEDCYLRLFTTHRVVRERRGEVRHASV